MAEIAASIRIDHQIGYQLLLAQAVNQYGRPKQRGFEALGGFGSPGLEVVNGRHLDLVEHRQQFSFFIHLFIYARNLVLAKQRTARDYISCCMFSSTGYRRELSFVESVRPKGHRLRTITDFAIESSKYYRVEWGERKYLVGRDKYQRVIFHFYYNILYLKVRSRVKRA